MMKDHFTLSEENLRAGRFHTLITPVFSHSEVHRLMLSTSSIFLIAGSAVGTLGQARLLGLYLASGLLSSIAGLAIARDSARGKGLLQHGKVNWTMNSNCVLALLTAQEAPPRTWRFGANGAILGVGGFVANMFPSLPLKAKLLLIPALVAQGAVFSVVGTHSEGLEVCSCRGCVSGLHTPRLQATTDTLWVSWLGLLSLWAPSVSTQHGALLCPSTIRHSFEHNIPMNTPVTGYRFQSDWSPLASDTCKLLSTCTATSYLFSTGIMFGVPIVACFNTLPSCTGTLGYKSCLVSASAATSQYH